uniref:RRM domain-containing protein n=1 Tax=Nelumbo nucifera TaxID=4432 RepID=A0A822ZM28_NELNU|nr:TPA_asm: hypothetical protein HUJ06_002765 [Nelumbo nucifera]
MAAAEAHPPPTPLQVTSLYVGDLDPRVSERELYEAFTSLSGSITSIHLCRDSSGRSLRYAYVNFISHDKASKALDSLNHTYLIGKPMRIMWSQKDPLPRKSGVANLFVKNLDHSVDSAGLQEIFSKFGNILSCKVAEENGQSKGFGFVQFDSEESALAAIKALHDTLLHGKKLYVSKFIKKSDRQNTCELKYTNLYVKNLDHDLTEDLLLDKFSDFGKVCNVVIMKDNQGKSKGFGFINFESAEDAKKAVEAMNGAKLGSKTLYVGRAQKKAEREKILKHTYEELQNKQTDNMKNSNVYVKNLDVSVDDSKLQELFSSCGKITSARVMHYDDGRSKGFGFVSFSTPKEAKKALNTLNGKMFEGRSLYVTMVQCKENHRTASASHLQFAQHPSGFLPSSVSNFAPELLPTLHGVSYKMSHQPIMYQQIGMNMAALFTPKEQYYGTMLPTSVRII